MELNVSYPHLTVESGNDQPLYRVCRELHLKRLEEFYIPEDRLIVELSKFSLTRAIIARDEIRLILNQLNIDANQEEQDGIKNLMNILLALGRYSDIDYWFINPENRIQSRLFSTDEFRKIEFLSKFWLQDYQQCEEICTDLLYHRPLDFEARSFRMKARIASGNLKNAFCDLSFICECRIPERRKANYILNNLRDKDVMDEEGTLKTRGNSRFICLAYFGLYNTTSLINRLIEENERLNMFARAELGQMVTSSSGILTLIPRDSLEVPSERFLNNCFFDFMVQNDSPDVDELIFYFADSSYGSYDTCLRTRNTILRALEGYHMNYPKFIHLV